MIALRYWLTSILLFALSGCAAPQMSSDGMKPSEPHTSANGLHVLASGADIAGANGIHFGPDGLLYVASVIGSEIVVVDPETGAIIRRLTKGVVGPDDIAFRSDGSLYWTSILTGEVVGLRPDGSLITIAKLTPGSNPITFSDDDRLFVSQCFFDDKLYEVDPDGIVSPRLISDQLGPHCGLNGMDWGPDGRLYGPRWFRNEVVSFDVDALDMKVEATGFEIPAAVKFDSKGRLHVLDTSAGTVLRVDGDEHVLVATFSPGLDNLAFDAEDRLFVSSFVDGSIVRVNADGTQTMLTPAGMAHPGGLALRRVLDEAGNTRTELLVADLQSIRGFDSQTGESTFVERNVFGVSEMGSVSNLSIDGDNLILTSWLDGTVKIWDPQTKQVIENHVELAGPVSAIRYAGRIIIAEHGKGRVIAIGAPTHADKESSLEIIASHLTAPTGLTIRGGDLFVGDHANGEIIRIARDGAALEIPEIVVSGLSAPEGIAATETGFIVFEGASGRVIEILDSGESVELARIDPGVTAPTEAQPPSMIFGGVVVDTNGFVYVTDASKRTLLKIERP